MSILSDRKLCMLLATGELEIEPLDFDQIQPASIDLTLADRVLVDGTKPHTLPLQVRRGMTLLASTVERVRIPTTLAGRLEGKSSWARRFLFVHAAGFVDPGFEGQLTLELVYMGLEPLLLEAGAPICQLALMEVAGTVARPYGHPELHSHFQNQRGATPA